VGSFAGVNSVKTEINPEDLLGKAAEDPLVQAFLLAGGGSVESEPADEEEEDQEGDGELYLSNLRSGISMLVQQDGVATVFLYTKGIEGARQYSRRLPRGLAFDMDRAAVRGAVGAPSASSDGGFFLGDRILAWDRFDCGGWHLHVEYLESGKIRMVSVMRRPPG
jgi:hypothetical protein